MQVIGGIQLTNDMIVAGGTFDDSNYVDIHTTIGGNPVIVHRVKQGVTILTLTGDDKTGWQHYSVVQALLSLSRSGNPFNVDLNGNLQYCIFYGDVEFTKLHDHIPDGHEMDFYTGKFSLLVIQ